MIKKFFDNNFFYASQYKKLITYNYNDIKIYKSKYCKYSFLKHT